MSGNLYQLETQALPGQHVIIGGPFDTYGKVMARQEGGFHLIRGVGHLLFQRLPKTKAQITI